MAYMIIDYVMIITVEHEQAIDNRYRLTVAVEHHSRMTRIAVHTVQYADNVALFVELIKSNQYQSVQILKSKLELLDQTDKLIGLFIYDIYLRHNII